MFSKVWKQTFYDSVLREYYSVRMGINTDEVSIAIKLNTQQKLVKVLQDILHLSKYRE